MGGGYSFPANRRNGTSNTYMRVDVQDAYVVRTGANKVRKHMVLTSKASGELGKTFGFNGRISFNYSIIRAVQTNSG